MCVGGQCPFHVLVGLHIRNCMAHMDMGGAVLRPGARWPPPQITVTDSSPVPL